MVKPKTSDLLVFTATTVGLIPTAYAATIKNDITYKEYSSFAMNFQQYYVGSDKALSYSGNNVAHPLNFSVPNFSGVSDLGNSVLLDQYQFLATSANAQVQKYTTFSTRYLANPFLIKLFSVPEGVSLDQFIDDEFIPKYETVTASVDDASNFKVARQNTIITDAYGISYLPPVKASELVKIGALVATVNAGPVKNAIYKDTDVFMTDSYLYMGGVNKISSINEDAKAKVHSPTNDYDDNDDDDGYDYVNVGGNNLATRSNPLVFTDPSANQPKVPTAGTTDSESAVGSDSTTEHHKHAHKHVTPLLSDNPADTLKVTTTLATDPDLPLGIVASSKYDLGSPLFIWDKTNKTWSYLGSNVKNTGHGFNTKSVYASNLKALSTYVQSFNYTVDKEGPLDFYGSNLLAEAATGDGSVSSSQLAPSLSANGAQLGFVFNGKAFYDDAQAKNLIFTNSNIINLHHAVDTGVGYLRFNKSGLIQGDAQASLKTAGIIVDKDVSVTVNLDNHDPKNTAKQVWRKMGAGTLIITNTGSNDDDLYVGQGTVYLNKVSGNAVKNLHLTNGDSRVVFTKADQVKGENIFFGTHGGVVDLDGFDLHTSQIYHIDHGAVISNSDNTKKSTFTLVNTLDSSHQIPERMYLGTFQGNLDVNFDLGATSKLTPSIELRGYNTNITGDVNIISGNVKIMGDSIYDSSDYSSIYGIYSCATLTANNINVYENNRLILSRGSHLNAQINLESNAQLVIQTRGVVNDKLQPWFKDQKPDWQVDWNRIDITKDIYFNVPLYHTHSSTGHQVPHVGKVESTKPEELAPIFHEDVNDTDASTGVIGSATHTASESTAIPTHSTQPINADATTTDLADPMDHTNDNDDYYHGSYDPDQDSGYDTQDAADTSSSEHGNVNSNVNSPDPLGTSPLGDNNDYAPYSLHQDFLIYLDNNHQARVTGNLYGSNVLIEKQGLGRIEFLGTKSDISGNLLIDEGQVHFYNEKSYDKLHLISSNPYSVVSIEDTTNDPTLNNLLHHLDGEFTGIINLNNNLEAGIDVQANNFAGLTFGTTGKVVIGNDKHPWATGIEHLNLGANGGTLEVNGLSLDHTARTLTIGNDDSAATVVLDKVEENTPLAIDFRGDNTLLVIKDNSKRDFINLPYSAISDYSVHKGLTDDSLGILYVTDYSKNLNNSYDLDGAADASLGAMPWSKLDIDYLGVQPNRNYSFTAGTGAIVNLNLELANGHNLVLDAHYNNHGYININADNSKYTKNQIFIVDNFIGEPDKNGNNGSIQVNLNNNNALGLGNILNIIGNTTLNLNGYSTDVFLGTVDGAAKIENVKAAYDYENFAQEKLNNRPLGSSPKYNSKQLKAPLVNFTVYNPEGQDVSIDAKITGRINLIFNGTANYQLSNPYNNIEGDYIVNSGTLYDLLGTLSQSAPKGNIYINDTGSLVLAHDFKNNIYVNLHSYYREKPVISVLKDSNVTINGLIGHSDIIVAGDASHTSTVNFSHVNTNGHTLYLRDLTTYNPSFNDPQSKQVGIYEGKFLSKDQINESHYATVNKDGLHIDVNNDGIDDTASNVILINSTLHVSGDNKIFNDANKLSTLVLSNSTLELSNFHPYDNYQGFKHTTSQTLISVLGDGVSYFNVTGAGQTVLSQRLQLDDLNTVLTISANSVDSSIAGSDPDLIKPTGLINNLALKGYGTLNFNLPKGAFGSTVVYNSPEFAGTVDFSANQTDPNQAATVEFNLNGTQRDRTIAYSIKGNKNTTLINANPNQALYLGNLNNFQGTLKIGKDDAPIILYGDQTNSGLGFTIDTAKDNIEFNVEDDKISYINDFTVTSSTRPQAEADVALNKTGTGVLILGDQINLGKHVNTVNINQGTLLLDGKDNSVIFSTAQHYNVQTYGVLGFGGSENVTLCSTVQGKGSFAVLANKKETSITTDLDHLQVDGAFNLIRGTLRLKIKNPELKFEHKVVGTDQGVLELVNDLPEQINTFQPTPPVAVTSSGLNSSPKISTQNNFTSVVLESKAIADLKNFKGTIHLGNQTRVDFSTNTESTLPDLALSSDANGKSQIRNLGSAKLTLYDLSSYTGEVYAVNGDIVLSGEKALSSHATLIEQNNKHFYLNIEDVTVSAGATDLDANDPKTTTSSGDEAIDSDVDHKKVVIDHGVPVSINSLLNPNYFNHNLVRSPNQLKAKTTTDKLAKESANDFDKESALNPEDHELDSAQALAHVQAQDKPKAKPQDSRMHGSHGSMVATNPEIDSNGLIHDPAVANGHIALRTLVDVSSLKTEHTTISKVGSGAIKLVDNSTFHPDQINIEQGSLVLQTNLFTADDKGFDVKSGANLVLDFANNDHLVGKVAGAGNLVLAKDAKVKASQVSTQTIVYTNNQTLTFNLDTLGVESPLDINTEGLNDNFVTESNDLSRNADLSVSKALSFTHAKNNLAYSDSESHSGVKVSSSNSVINTEPKTSAQFIQLPTFVGEGKVVLNPTTMSTADASPLNVIINGNLDYFKGTITTDSKINLFVQSANTILNSISGNGTIISDFNSANPIVSQKATSIIGTTDSLEANHLSPNSSSQTTAGNSVNSDNDSNTGNIDNTGNSSNIKLSEAKAINSAPKLLLFSDQSGFSGKLIAKNGDIAVISDHLTSDPTYIIDKSNLLLADATKGTLDLSQYKIINPTGTNFLINVANRNLELNQQSASAIKNIALSQGQLAVTEDITLNTIENAATINLGQHNLTVGNFNSVGGHINLELNSHTDQARVSVLNPVSTKANQNLNINIKVNDQTRKLLINTDQKLAKTSGYVSILNLDDLNHGHLYKLVLSSADDNTVVVKAKTTQQIEQENKESNESATCNSVTSNHCTKEQPAKSSTTKDYKVVAVASSKALNLLQVNNVVRSVHLLPPPNLDFTNTVSVGVINASFIDKHSHSYVNSPFTHYQNRSFVDGFTISTNHNIAFSPQYMFNIWGDYRHTEVKTRTAVEGLDVNHLDSSADSINTALSLRYSATSHTTWYVGGKLGYTLSRFTQDHNDYKIGYLSTSVFGAHSYQFTLPYQFDLKLRNQLGFNFMPMVNQNLTKYVNSELTQFKTKTPYSFSYNTELSLGYGTTSVALELGAKYDLTKLQAQSGSEQLVDSTNKRFNWNSAIKLNFEPNKVMILSLSYQINNEFRSLNQSFQVNAGFKW